MAYELAQVNVARLVAPLHAPQWPTSWPHSTR